MNHLELSDDDEFVIVKDWYKVSREWRCHVLVNHPGSGWREMNGNWTQVPEVVCIKYYEHHTDELFYKGRNGDEWVEYPRGCAGNGTRRPSPGLRVGSTER